MFKHLQAKQLFDAIKSKITIYSAQEATEITFWLLEHYLKLTKTDILLGKDIENDKTDWENIIARINNYEPIQYILGETNFCGSRFLVNPAVLIPRPETEELVNMIVKENKAQRHRGTEAIRHKGIKEQSNEEKGVINTQDTRHKTQDDSIIQSLIHSIIDIGTGSGCIAISLAKAFPASSVFAWDISISALETATQNAKINEVKNIRFEQKNILEGIRYKGTKAQKHNDISHLTSHISHQTESNIAPNISLIVSNPPYITPSESVEMRANVMKHEPHLALFVPEHDPLLFYRAIAQFAQNNLAQNGQIWLEINDQFGTETTLLFEQHGFVNTKILKDFQGKDRFIRSSR